MGATVRCAGSGWHRRRGATFEANVACIPAVSTDALSKRFGTVVAVDGLDLEVARGEVFGYLGPNGAGKTTTIRLLLDFIRPTSGTATILGRSTRLASSRERVGYLPAELHVDPRYTVEDVIR